VTAVAEVLLRGPNWLGDLVMCTPAFRALREGLPSARITLHLRHELLPVMTGAPWFDELLPVRSYHRGALSMWREGRALRTERRFDLGICIPDSWSSALLMRAAGVRRVVGYRSSGRELLLHESLAPPSDAGPRRLVAREHYALALVESVGAVERGTHLELFTTDDEEARAAALLVERGVDPNDGFVALAPGASYGSSKLWPAKSFARVGDDAAARGLGVVVLGAPGEAVLAGRVVAAMSGPAANLAGALDPGALKAVLRRARVLVCNDAGARHVAVAFGVPCVVMMGPTSLAKTDCNLDRVRVVETDVACRPCYERVCPIDHRCMTRLTPERVSAEVEACLAEGSSSAGRPAADNGGTCWKEGSSP
jgi:heptosyltransferase-2